jgi:hypothetical protein
MNNNLQQKLYKMGMHEESASSFIPVNNNTQTINEINKYNDDLPSNVHTNQQNDYNTQQVTTATVTAAK